MRAQQFDDTGMVYAEKGEYDKAIHSYDKAIQLNSITNKTYLLKKS